MAEEDEEVVEPLDLLPLEVEERERQRVHQDLVQPGGVSD